MEKLFQNASPDYWSTLEKAGFYHQVDAGCLRFSDQGRLDFLQRQTTNDLSGLRIGKAVTTLLISPTARILDVLKLIDEGEHILALTLPGHGSDTLHYLTQRIFFMDKVQISDVTQQFIQIDLEGLDASDVLKKIGIESAQSIDEVAKATFMGNPVRVLGQVGFFGRGFRLVVPAASYQQFREALIASGAVELSPESYHILRVESGLPAAGTELTDEYTPLEVGMEQAISDSKGCYPGQEVIARQVTYNKITQRFVRLKLHTPAFPGDRLYFEDKRAGKITSAVVSPRFGPRALAVVRKPYFEPGTILRAGEEGVRGTVE